MAQVKFVVTDAVKFAALATKDEGTLYFIEDLKQIYRGSVLYGGGVYKAVDVFPTTDTAERNVLYVNTTTGATKFYDGNEFVDVVLPKATSLSTSSTDEYTPTAKAVVDYVASTVQNLETGKLADRVAAVETKASNNEAAIATINGTGEGSFAKAASDAGAAAQTAAEKTAANALSTAKTELQANIDKKADSATTLAGYGITDAYTKSDTDEAIATAVANAHHLKREIVDALPDVSAADEDTIYMVPKSSGDAGSTATNIYAEYMVINGKFEQIGDSAVDLTDYIKTADAESKISTAKTEAVNTAASDATTKANTALSSAKSYADGLAKNYATAAQGAKADTALQSSDIVEGTTNGAVSVKGTSVKVHGLGSAAYTDSTAYATAAQGTKADSALQSSDITTGTANGTISVKGTDVSIKGLGSAAYTASSAYDKAGAATTALSSAKTYTDTAKTAAISAAATDATTKADNALSSAKSYTDTALEWGTL